MYSFRNMDKASRQEVITGEREIIHGSNLFLCGKYESALSAKDAYPRHASNDLEILATSPSSDVSSSGTKVRPVIIS